jgi:thioredoxin 1
MGDERRGDETEGKEEEVERKEERKPSSNVRMISSLAQIRELIEDSTSSSSPDDDDCEENDNNGGALVVLDFTSNNCPPCDMIRPVYDELSMLNEFAGTTMRRGGGDRSGPRVVFCKVNVSDHPDVAKYYGVDGWPTFLFFRDGILIDTIVGGNAAKEGLYGLVSKYA